MPSLFERLRRMPAASDTSRSRPWVLLDVEQERGAIDLVLVNVGLEPAYNVVVTFHERRRRVIERKGLHDIRLFKGLSLLRPERALRVFFDTVPGALRRDDVGFDPVFEGVVEYRDDAGRAYKEFFSHDVSIFADWPERV
jgi:hypothetical protein